MSQKYCRNFLVGISLSCGAFFLSPVDAGVRFLTRTVPYEVCEWVWISEGGAESTPENPYSGYYQEVCRIETREEEYTEITPDEEPPPPPPPDVLPPDIILGGGGGTPSPAPSPDAARIATCGNLAGEMLSMNCDSRRSRPAHQQDINFTSPLPDFMKPILYNFHTTL